MDEKLAPAQNFHQISSFPLAGNFKFTTRPIVLIKFVGTKIETVMDERGERGRRISQTQDGDENRHELGLRMQREIKLED